MMADMPTMMMTAADADPTMEHDDADDGTM